MSVRQVVEVGGALRYMYIDSDKNAEGTNRKTSKTAQVVECPWRH